METCNPNGDGIAQTLNSEENDASAGFGLSINYQIFELIVKSEYG